MRIFHTAIDFFALVITGFWPASFGHVADRVLQNLLVGDRFAHAHVEDDLRQARHLHRRLVAELLDQRRDDFLLVDLP